jgi:hypothetical protein
MEDLEDLSFATIEERVWKPQLPLEVDDEGMTPRVLTFGLAAAAQEQDGYSKPKKPNAS